MATFVLIHGAGDVGWYWHLTEAGLRARGHQTIAPDLPCDNDTATLDDYAGTVADAAAGRQGLVIVGQSHGAFAATLAASQLPARLLVLVAGMIPTPGESPGPWWPAPTTRRHHRSDLHAVVTWARATRHPDAPIVRQRPFPDEHAPELIGVALAYHYINRMVNIFAAASPFPVAAPGLKPIMRRVASLAFRRLLACQVHPGA